MDNNIAVLQEYLDILSGENPSLDSSDYIDEFKDKWDTEMNIADEDLIIEINDILAFYDEQSISPNDCVEQLKNAISSYIAINSVLPTNEEAMPLDQTIIDAIKSTRLEGYEDGDVYDIVSKQFLISSDEVERVAGANGLNIAVATIKENRIVPVTLPKAYVVKEEYYLPGDEQGLWLDKGVTVYEQGDGFYRTDSQLVPILSISKEDIKSFFKVVESKVSDGKWQEILERYEENYEPANKLDKFTDILAGKGMSNDYTVSVLNNMYRLYEQELDPSLVTKLKPIFEAWKNRMVDSKDTFSSLQAVFGIGCANEDKIPDDTFKEIDDKIAGILSDIEVEDPNSFDIDDYPEKNSEIGYLLAGYGYTHDDWNSAKEDSLVMEAKDDDQFKPTNESAGDYQVTWTDREYNEHHKDFKNDPDGAPENALAKAKAYAKKLNDKDKKSELGLYRSVDIKPLSEAKDSPKASPELLEKEKAIAAKGKNVTYNKSKTDFCYVTNTGDKFALYDSTGAEIENGTHLSCIVAKDKFLKESLIKEEIIPQDILGKIVADITNKNHANGTASDSRITADVLAEYGYDKDDYMRALKEGKGVVKNDVTFDVVPGNVVSYGGKNKDDKTISFKKGDTLSYGNDSNDDNVVIHANGGRYVIDKNKVKQAINEYVHKDGNKWKVYSKKGKVLGTHDSKKEADTQLAAIEANKAKNEALSSDGTDDKTILDYYNHLVEIGEKDKETMDTNNGILVKYNHPEIKIDPLSDTIAKFSNSGVDTAYIRKLVKSKNEAKINEAKTTFDLQVGDIIDIQYGGKEVSLPIRKIDRLSSEWRGETIDRSRFYVLPPDREDRPGAEIALDPDEIKIHESAYNEPKTFLGADAIGEEVVDKVTKDDLVDVYNTMVRYGRTFGYMDKIDGKLKFFDSDPRLKGTGAAPVSIDDLKSWIADYDQDANEAYMAQGYTPKTSEVYKGAYDVAIKVLADTKSSEERKAASQKVKDAYENGKKLDRNIIKRSNGYGPDNTKIDEDASTKIVDVDDFDDFISKIMTMCPDYTEKTQTPELTTYYDKDKRLIGQWRNYGDKVGGKVIEDNVDEMIGDPNYWYDETASAGSDNGYEFQAPYGYNDMPIIEDINNGMSAIMDSLKNGSYDHAATAKLMEEMPYSALTPACKTELQALLNSYHECLISGEDPKDIEAELMGFITPKKVEEPEIIADDKLKLSHKQIEKLEKETKKFKDSTNKILEWKRNKKKAH